MDSYKTKLKTEAISKSTFVAKFEGESQLFVLIEFANYFSPFCFEERFDDECDETEV